MHIRKTLEIFGWPPRCLLNFYVPEKNSLWLYESSTYRLCDIDDIVSRIIGNRRSGTIYFGLSAKSKKWPNWTEDRLQRIEELIRYDLCDLELCCDGRFSVAIERSTTVPNLPCTEEFLWKLKIRTWKQPISNKNMRGTKKRR